MNTLDTMKQALEAMEEVQKHTNTSDWFNERVDNLRLAIEQAERQEPGLHETDIYDFAGWLTTRPGVMEVGSYCEAGSMAEAVGEYIKTFPERFAAPPQRQPLTPVVPADANINQRLAFKAGWRAAEAAHGIGGEA